MRDSRRANRARLRPGHDLDELEDRCLLSTGTIGRHLSPAIEVHALKAAQVKHAVKPNSQAHKVKAVPKHKTHPHKAKPAPKHKTHPHKAKPAPKPPTFIYPVATTPAPSPTSTSTSPPTSTPTTPQTPTSPPTQPTTPPSSPQIPAVNQKVVAFAEAHLGQKVGRGECTDLAEAAYAAAGAVSETKLGPTGPDANYVWGNLVDTLTTANRSLANVLPGDVIQFRDVTLSHTTTYPNGSWSSTTSMADHHTAVVVSISGSTINVLEQNVGSAGTPDSVRYSVQRGSYDLSDLQAGTMWVYRPISLS